MSVLLFDLVTLVFDPPNPQGRTFLNHLFDLGVFLADFLLQLGGLAVAAVRVGLGIGVLTIVALPV